MAKRQTIEKLLARLVARPAGDRAYFEIMGDGSAEGQTERDDFDYIEFKTAEEGGFRAVLEAVLEYLEADDE